MYNDKHNYVLHIKMLKYYLKQGLKLKKINRAIHVQTKRLVKTMDRF